MSNAEIGSLLFLLFVFIASAHLLGYLFMRLRQPRVIGEILAGLILGPSILGRLASIHELSLLGNFSASAQHHQNILGFVYQLGLLLLMFISGIETRNLYANEDRRQITWLASVGTALPFFICIAAGAWIPLERLTGPAHQRLSVLLVVGIAVAVTSIPVISRIFYDLKILHTRFARLVLGVAVIEDIALWAVLAVATALATSGSLPARKVVEHVAAALIYFAVGLTLAPPLIKRISRARWNVLATSSPVGYVVAILFGYAAIAALFDVSLVFAAFLAGFGIVSEKERFCEALDSLSKFSFAVFIPVYFAIVGYKLDLSRSFSFAMVASFLAIACAIKLLSVSLGARLAGFRGLDNFNLAVATNARGGPGIVLASVAFDAGIINPAFFTTLILLAVITSQAAGAWLEYVLRRGWPLLSADRQVEPVVLPERAPESLAA